MKQLLFLCSYLLLGSMSALAQHEQLDYSDVINSKDFVDYTEEDLICSRDGMKIFGKIYRPKTADSKKVPMVIHCHGYNSSYGEPEPYAKALAKSGYGCVIFDFCGGGNRSKSEGKSTEMSVFTEQADAEAVMKTVSKMKWVDKKKIYLMGYSQGGLVSSITAAANPKKIAGLILIYPALLIPDHARNIHPKEAHHAESYDVMGLNISHIYYDRLLSYDVYEDVKKFKGPVAIIYGDKDSVTGFNSMERADTAFNSPEFHIIKDGTHGFPPAEHKIQTINYALDFLNREGAKKLISLSFDDGPNLTTTMQMLDVMEKHNVVGSFFVVGNNITEQTAAAMVRATKLGCEVENHSRTHANNLDKASKEELQSEISYTSNLVKKFTGRSPQYFRPPYINVSQSMYDAIELPFICGIGCNDWEANVTSTQRFEKIVSEAKDGMIVLLHDMEGNKNTVEAIDRIIPELKKQGYQFVTVAELFKKKGVKPQRNTIYSYVNQ